MVPHGRRSMTVISGEAANLIGGPHAPAPLDTKTVEPLSKVYLPIKYSLTIAAAIASGKICPP
jgi:hypothetical protein